VSGDVRRLKLGRPLKDAHEGENFTRPVCNAPMQTMRRSFGSGFFVVVNEIVETSSILAHFARVGFIAYDASNTVVERIEEALSAVQEQQVNARASRPHECVRRYPNEHRRLR